MLDVTGRCDRVLLVGGDGIATATHIVPLLERCWPAIREVAAQLFSHSQASHDDVTKALGLSADPNTAAIGGLAHIRAGCPAG